MPNRYHGAAPSGQAAQQQHMQQGQQRIQQQYGQPIRTSEWRLGNPMPMPGDTRLHGGFNLGLHNRQMEERARLHNLRAGQARDQQALQGQAFAAGELDRRDQTRDELYGRARERVDEIRGDPMDAAIADELQRRISGESAPITDDVRNMMLSQGADQGAAMERAQLAGMGGRPGDPAFESMRMQTALGRQQDMQGMTRDLAIQQQLQNFAARGQAMGQGAGFTRARQDAISGADRRVQDLLANEEFGVSLPTRQLSLQDYMRMRGG